jgi:hypothetical protein
MYRALDRDSTEAMRNFKLAAQSIGLKDPWVARIGGFGIPVPTLEDHGKTASSPQSSTK